MNEDDKKQLQESLILIDTGIDTFTQKKKEELEFLKKEFSLMPFEKINDDIFDTDSEVLKSEKFHNNWHIKLGEDDINNLETFRLFLVYLREVLENEGLIDRTTNLKPSV